MPRYDLNILETAAARYTTSGEFEKAIRIYLFMADGDSSLDGGYLGEKLGQCYEAIGNLVAAKYWYGRAIEENPDVRQHAVERRKALDNVDVTDIVADYIVGDS